MSTEENIAIVRRLYEEVNKRTFAHRRDGNSFLTHVAGRAEPQTTEESIKRSDATYAAFPDFQMNVDDTIADGDKVVTRGHWTGTHQAEYQGIPPTGKRVTVSSMNVFRFEDGKIAERWIITDQLGLLQQLGAVAEPGQAPS
jgi:steroid delta-isomerase-like uncharacterized protein